MTNKEAAVELRKFIDNFSALGPELTEETVQLSAFDIPQFKLPYWPDTGQSVGFSLGLRRIWWPEKDINSKIVRIRKRIVVIEMDIARGGTIDVTCRHPLDLQNMIQFSSQNTNSAMSCFIVFSQLLKPAFKKLTKAVDKVVKKKKLEKDECLRMSDAVKKSFKPLVPFIVADKLSE